MKRLLLFLLISVSIGAMASKPACGLWQKIQGDWYQPHDFEILEAIIDINFHSDSTFVFNAYDGDSQKMVRLTGTYATRGKRTIVLHYPDGSREKLTYQENVLTRDGVFSFIVSKRRSLRLIRP
jgi:hypothetical protein